jgi:hypothetical protein
MSDSNIENTQPTQPAIEQTMPVRQPVGDTSPTPVRPKKPQRWPWVLLGIFAMLLLGGLGTYIGYQFALKDRAAAYQSQVTTLATEQFMQALQEQASGSYEAARRRLEYVIQLDPNFPGAMDRLTEVMLAMAITRTPTPAPEPTEVIPTPTPDFRGEEEIFNQARQFMVNKEWESALQTLDGLRDKNPSYRAIDVDGMYYVSLRYRGYLRIGRGQLETGIYDLTLSERFAPLDEEAKGMRTWARYYINGASFWEVRWEKVVFYFAQIYPFVPNMIDVNGITATERFRTGSLEYGKQLESEDKPCEALLQFQNGLAIRGDPEIEALLPDVTARCAELTAGPQEPTPTLGEITPTPSLTPEGPTPTPSLTPEPPTDTPEPSATSSSP